MNQKICAKFAITGLVQGVGFRYYIYRNAQELGLNGYARNMADGSVECVIEGNTDIVEKMHQLLKIGPSRSYVDDCTVEYYDYHGQFNDFRIW